MVKTSSSAPPSITGSSELVVPYIPTATLVACPLKIRLFPFNHCPAVDYTLYTAYTLINPSYITMRPTLRATRLAGRRMNSSSAPQVNPQVQKAVEAASKAYAQSAATVKRVAGPVGEKIGGALGGMSRIND
jgi:hypothetical protein